VIRKGLDVSTGTSRGSADCIGVYLAPEDEDENNGEDDYNLDKHVMMEKSIQ
jgi:hypothetical protein